MEKDKRALKSGKHGAATLATVLLTQKGTSKA
jgi:hypothetical protein